MNRIPEPEVMDGKDQSEAYARADFTSVNLAFVERMAETLNLEGMNTAIDLGCGPAEIPTLLLRRFPHFSITAVDGSAAMLTWAKRRIEAENIKGLLLKHALLPLSPPTVPYDLIFSNSLLHHLHDPTILWNEILRQGASGTQVYIMDLSRPEDEMRAREIVEEYAADEADILKYDFYHSLLAAFRPNELELQLQDANLSQLRVQQVTDRHLVVSGVL